MSTKAWMITLGTAGALTLGGGIPLVALTEAPSFTTVHGTVATVDAAGHRIVIRPTGNTLMALDLGADQGIRTPAGPETLARLRPGQAVEARVPTHGRRRARWVRLES